MVGCVLVVRILKKCNDDIYALNDQNPFTAHDREYNMTVSILNTFSEESHV